MAIDLKTVVSEQPQGLLLTRLPSGLAVRELQTYLKKAGFETGKIDGIVGPKTLRAFANFKDAVYLADHHLIGPSSYGSLVTEALERSGPNRAKPELQLAAGVYKGGKQIRLPGIGLVYLEAPIVEGGRLSWNEITHGGTRLPPDAKVLEGMFRIAKLFEPARNLVDRALILTSGYRPPAINRAAGGATRSRHLVGDAIDGYVEGLSGNALAYILRDWPGGLGTYRRYPRLIHLDGGPWRRW